MLKMKLLFLLKETPESSLSLSLSLTREDTTRRQPPASQQEGPHQNRITWNLDLGLPHIWNCVV